MDDFNQICQICLEPFNKNIIEKMPKILPCCNTTICYKCLEKIFQKNDNKILCPICRKFTEQNPLNLPNNDKVFDGFLKCLNCNKEVIKTQLFLNFNEKVNLKCSNCQHDDSAFIDFLPDYLNELNGFIKEYYNKDSLIQKLENKIKKFLSDFFEEIKEMLFIQIKNKIINQINLIFNFDIEKDCEIFNNYLNEFKQKYDYLYSFSIDDTNKKFNSEDIINSINYFFQTSDIINKEKVKFNYISDFINNNELILLKEKINVKEVAEFLIRIFKIPILEDIKDQYDFLTGISIFDEQILNKIYEAKYSNENKNNITIDNNNKNIDNNNIEININNNLNDIKEEKLNNKSSIINKDNNTLNIIKKESIKPNSNNDTNNLNKKRKRTKK